MLFKATLYTFLLCLLFLVVYLCFWFLLRPYKKRRYYLRFSNDVAVTPKFIPLFGDFKIMKEQYIDKGKFIGDYIRDIVFRYPGKKAFFGNLPMDDFLILHDPALLNEFQKLVPSVIDREPIDTTGFGRVGGTGGLSQ